MSDLPCLLLCKVSEGMDFSDSRARCVVVTGIPYAPAMDPKVMRINSYSSERDSSSAKGRERNYCARKWFVGGGRGRWRKLCTLRSLCAFWLNP